VRIIFAALVFAPFTAWYGYLVVRAIATGVSHSLIGPVDRTSQPMTFCFWVVHRSLFGVALVAAFLAVALKLTTASSIRLFIGYTLVYITFMVATVFLTRQRPNNKPLERPGSAGRSAPSC
jgi:hypothetical protein